MNLLTRLLIGAGIFAGIMVVLMVVPAILGRILDPLNMRCIKNRCETAGFTAIEIKAWPNHYGVSFQSGGQKHYAKCRVVGRKIKWQGKVPVGL